MARPIKPDSTSQSIFMYVLDATTGLPYTGTPAYNDAGISLSYKRGATGSTTAITPATLAAETTAYASGGFKSLGGSMARLDLPDAAVAAGADYVLVKAVATAWKAVPMDIPLNFITEANIQSECEDALVAKGLDHLVSTSVTGTDVADNSIVAKLVSKSATADWDNYDNTTDSLQANRDNIGTTGTALATIPWNANWDAEVESEATDALNAYDPPTNTEMEARTIAAASYALASGVTVTTNNDKTGYRLSSTGVDDVLDEVVSGVVTLRQYIRGFAAALLGKKSGEGTATVVFRNPADTVNAITATIDDDGNRTAVSMDYS